MSDATIVKELTFQNLEVWVKEGKPATHWVITDDLENLLPIPGMDSCIKAIEAKQKEYNWPANPTNNARIGWEAARLYFRNLYKVN